MGIFDSLFKKREKEYRNSLTSESAITDKQSRDLDDVHLALLSLYQKPYPFYTKYALDYWEKDLGRPYKDAIDDFIREGLIEQPSIEEKLNHRLRVPAIKQILKKNSLKVSGNKNELLSRVLDNLPDAAKEIAASITDVYVCTPEGLQKVKAYNDAVSLRRNNAVAEVKECLKRRNFYKAAEIVKKFNASLPSALAHNEPNEDDARIVLNISAAQGISHEELETIKLEAALKVFWGEGIIGPESFVSLATNKIGKERSRQALEWYKSSGVVKYVEILCAQDSCDICRAMGGKRYLINSAPLLPIDGCCDEMGCRCTYVAAFDE
jgi:hypothetical protein